MRGGDPDDGGSLPSGRFFDHLDRRQRMHDPLRRLPVPIRIPSPNSPNTHSSPNSPAIPLPPTPLTNTSSIPETTRSGSVPTNRTVPASTASGRSVTSRVTNTGFPSDGASSWIPPSP